MWDYVQVLVALGSILIEFESFRNARFLFEAKTRVEGWKKVLSTYPDGFLLLFGFCGIGYAVCSIVWAFNSQIPIRVAGITLLVVTTMEISFKWFCNRPLIKRIDSTVCILCLLTVVITKGWFL